MIREHAKARDFTNRRYRYRGVVDEIERAKNRTKSKVRARVEHAIGMVDAEAIASASLLCNHYDHD